MRETLATVGAILGALLLMTLVSWGGYLAYLKFVEGPAITQHAQNVRHSLNFVQAQNSIAESAIGDYQGDSGSGDTAHAQADVTRACSAANSIAQSEQNPDVRQFAAQHCAGQ